MPRPISAEITRQPMFSAEVEQIKFWLRIMEEHALFIQAGLPHDRRELIDRAGAFAREFADLARKADRVQPGRKFRELAGAARDAVRQFFRFKRQLLRMMLTGELRGNNFPLLLDHMSREAAYAARLLAHLAAGRPAFCGLTPGGEVAFWTRLMQDHTAFIRQRLDPSERVLIETAENFMAEFDGLAFEARDFDGMMRPFWEEAPAFGRFLQDLRVAVTGLRDFKAAAERMIIESRIVSIIPVMLADHTRREADYFLRVLALVANGAVQAGQGDQLDAALTEDDAGLIGEFADDRPQEEAPKIPEAEVAAAATAQTASASAAEDDDADVAEDAPGDEDDDEDAGDEEEDDELPPPPSKKAQLKPPKYQWTGKWPRPLGGARA